MIGTVEELELEEDESDNYYEDDYDDEEDFSDWGVEWMSDCDTFYIKEKPYDVSWTRIEETYRIEDICCFLECPSYCGGLIISDIVCDIALFKQFVAELGIDTPYSQLLCDDITNEIFLALGAINIGGVLLLEVV